VKYVSDSFLIWNTVSTVVDAVVVARELLSITTVEVEDIAPDGTDKDILSSDDIVVVANVTVVVDIFVEVFTRFDVTATGGTFDTEELTVNVSVVNCPEYVFVDPPSRLVAVIL